MLATRRTAKTRRSTRPGGFRVSQRRVIRHKVPGTAGPVLVSLTPAAVDVQVVPIGATLTGSSSLATAAVDVQVVPLTVAFGGVTVALKTATIDVRAVPMVASIEASNLAFSGASGNSAVLLGYRTTGPV